MWITEHNIFKGVHISLLLTHLQLYSEKKPPFGHSVRNHAEHLYWHKYKSCFKSKALIQMPVTVLSRSDIKDNLQHCITNKAMVLCQGHMPKHKRAIQKVGVLPTQYFAPAKENPHILIRSIKQNFFSPKQMKQSWYLRKLIHCPHIPHTLMPNLHSSYNGVMPEVRPLPKPQQREDECISEPPSLLLLLLPKAGPWQQDVNKRW